MGEHDGDLHVRRESSRSDEEDEGQRKLPLPLPVQRIIPSGIGLISSCDVMLPRFC